MTLNDLSDEEKGDLISEVFSNKYSDKKAGSNHYTCRRAADNLLCDVVD